MNTPEKNNNIKLILFIYTRIELKFRLVYQNFKNFILLIVLFEHFKN